MQLTGSHDVDQKWIEEVKKTDSDPQPKILPRVLFENWDLPQLKEMVSKTALRTKIKNLLVDECLKQKFDGLVIELGMFPFSKVPFRGELISFLRSISDSLHQHKLLIFLVIPPQVGSGQQYFEAKDLKDLSKIIDRFSLMTYDFASTQGKPGPSSPLWWIVHNVVSLISHQPVMSKKLLVGLNFYGSDFQITRDESQPVEEGKEEKRKAEMRAITGSNFIDILKTIQASNDMTPLVWDQSSHEHAIAFDDNHILYFPTLMSISLRLQRLAELGTGISIWEIGQGLDYFYDLL